MFLTICFSPDEEPERKLELVLPEQAASRLGQVLTSGSVGLIQEFNLSDANGICPRRVQTLTKDELNMDSPHISVERAVACLHGEELDSSEEEHLFRCDECRRLVVEASATELKSPPGDSIGKKSDS